MDPQKQPDNVSTKILYNRIKRGLTLLMFLMLLIILSIPGVLRLLYRADSQVALGHAKSVRTAIQVTGMEWYGGDKTFCDASSKGGVAEGLYEEILMLSKAPGDFQVVETDESGYQVQQFIYREGEFTVWFQAEPRSYKVYHDSLMIDTGEEE